MACVYKYNDQWLSEEEVLKVLSERKEFKSLYQNLLKELETGRGKDVLDRVKRDYVRKFSTFNYESLQQEEKENIYYDWYYNWIASFENENEDENEEGGGDWHPSNAEKEAAFNKYIEDKSFSGEYTLEEQQEEAIVELVSLMTADKLDKVKDKNLISLLKQLLKEMKQFVRTLLSQKEVNIDSLPDNMTIEDLSNLLAYSNSKLILPGFEVEYTTPDNMKFKTYQEASNHISELAKSVEDVDLSVITIKRDTPIVKTADEIKVNSFISLVSEENMYAITYYKDKNNIWYERGSYKHEFDESPDDIISDKKIVELYNTYKNPSENMLELYIEKNRQFEISKEIIEEWKKVNNIQYNPEEVYSRGQEFVSVIGAYSNFDVNLMMQNLLEHIEDNKRAGGQFAISAFTRRTDEIVDKLEDTKSKIRFKIYPKSEDILWATNKDAYSGSVWEAAEKTNKNIKSELLGISYTKYPRFDDINAVQPNLVDITDYLIGEHNELGIVLNGNNFRLEYDDDIPPQTKKIIDGVNRILDQKYGKLVKPEITTSLGIQPVQSFYTLTETIDSVIDRINSSILGSYQILENKDEEGGESSWIVDYYLGEKGYMEFFYTEQEANDFIDSIINKHGTNEYTSQALINTKIAKLKEVAKKYPRSLIRSEVKKIENTTSSYKDYDDDDMFQKLPSTLLSTDEIEYNDKGEILAFKEFQQSLNKPDTNPILTGNIKPDIILPIGTSGSGKSTWIKSVNTNNQFVVISPDDMRVEFTGDMNNKSKDDEIYQAVTDRAIQAVKEGKQVIVDTTNLKKERRRPFIDAVKKALPNTVIQYKLLPLNPELAKQRIKADIEAGINRANVPDSTIDRHAKSYNNMLEDIKSEDISNYDYKEEQEKKFKELQEKLQDKTFLEAVKSVFDNSSKLQQFAYETFLPGEDTSMKLSSKEEVLSLYTDYVAKIALGIIKNPSSGEYNDNSKAKDIVYHGSNTKNIEKFDMNLLGSSTPNPTNKLGTYFINNPKFAGMFSGGLYVNEFFNEIDNLNKLITMILDKTANIDYIKSNIVKLITIPQLRQQIRTLSTTQEILDLLTHYYNELEKYENSGSTNEGSRDILASPNSKIYSVLLNIVNPYYITADDFHVIIEQSKTDKDLILLKDLKTKSKNNDSIIVSSFEKGEEIMYGFELEADNYISFDPNQIHILDSKQDIEGFEKHIFNKNKQLPVEVLDNIEEIEDISLSKNTDAFVYNTFGSTKATLKNLTKLYPDAIIVKDESELPLSVQEAISAMDSTGEVKGLFRQSDGNVYLILSNIKTIEEADKVYRHELLGHKGVMAELGKELTDYSLNLVYNATGIQLKNIENIADIYYGKPISKLNKEELSQVGQEYIAKVAENANIDVTVFEKIKAIFKKLLRKYNINIDIKDYEIKIMLRNIEYNKTYSKYNPNLNMLNLQIGTMDKDIKAKFKEEIKEAIKIVKNGFNRTTDLTTLINMVQIRNGIDLRKETRLAPNGVISNLNENDWLYVRTDNYIDKHINNFPYDTDENGEPIFSLNLEKNEISLLNLMKNERLYKYIRDNINVPEVTTKEIHKKLLEVGFNSFEYDTNQIPFIRALVNILYNQDVDNSDSKDTSFDIKEFEKYKKGKLIKLETVADVLQYEHYYDPNELLCTFGNIEDRLANRNIWMFISDNIDNIVRPSYEHMKYDEYSTSLMMIQVAKPESIYETDYIISRYNHTVDKPNYMYEAILDNFYPGLSNYLGQVEKPIDYNSSYKIHDNKIYKFDSEVYGTSYYYNNKGILTDFGLYELNPNYHTYLGEGYIYDSKNKNVFFAMQEYDHKEDIAVKSLYPLFSNTHTKIDILKETNNGIVKTIVTTNDNQYYNVKEDKLVSNKTSIIFTPHIYYQIYPFLTRASMLDEYLITPIIEECDNIYITSDNSNLYEKLRIVNDSINFDSTSVENNIIFPSLKMISRVSQYISDKNIYPKLQIITGTMEIYEDDIIKKGSDINNIYSNLEYCNHLIVYPGTLPYLSVMFPNLKVVKKLEIRLNNKGIDIPEILLPKLQLLDIVEINYYLKYNYNFYKDSNWYEKLDIVEINYYLKYNRINQPTDSYILDLISKLFKNKKLTFQNLSASLVMLKIDLNVLNRWDVNVNIKRHTKNNEVINELINSPTISTKKDDFNSYQLNKAVEELINSIRRNEEKTLYDFLPIDLQIIDDVDIIDTNNVTIKQPSIFVLPKTAQLILPIGISGSGKSTWINSLDKDKYTIISPDLIRKELTGNVSDQSKNIEVFAMSDKLLDEALRRGKKVILDATNLNTVYRRNMISKLKSLYPDLDIRYKLLDVDPNIAKQRIATDISNNKDRSNTPNEIIDLQYEQFLLFLYETNIDLQFNEIIDLQYEQFLQTKEDIKDEPIHEFRDSKSIVTEILDKYFKGKTDVLKRLSDMVAISDSIKTNSLLSDTDNLSQSILTLIQYNRTVGELLYVYPSFKEVFEGVDKNMKLSDYIRTKDIDKKVENYVTNVKKDMTDNFNDYEEYLSKLDINDIEDLENYPNDKLLKDLCTQ